ncbi:azaphilone polyketide synthase [Apiospora sp. TS-2023a]
MASTPPLMSTSGVTVLLFGSQALSFSPESLKTLQDFLHQQDDCKWMLDTVSELAVYWGKLVTQFPKLHETPGEKLLGDLNKWLHGHDIEKATFQLPNILLTPLVVLTQLTQFIRYLSHSLSGASLSASDVYQTLAQQKVETVGLCTGLLSASAISSSWDRASFQKYGAAAVRLAMAISALVDAQDVSDSLHGLSKSFALG